MFKCNTIRISSEKSFFLPSLHKFKLGKIKQKENYHYYSSVFSVMLQRIELYVTIYIFSFDTDVPLAWKNARLLGSAYLVTPVEEVQITQNLITSCLSFAMSLLASTAALAHAHGSCFFPLHWHAPRVASWKENKQTKKRENQHLEDAVLLAFLGHMALTDKVKSMRK